MSPVRFLLFLVTYSCAQSVSRSNTCLRRSVLVFTSSSSTYLITDLGTTTLAPTSRFCPNVSTSTATTTVYQKLASQSAAITSYASCPNVSVSTVYQQAPSQPAASGTMITNNGFEGGNSSPFNSSASGPGVSAQVAGRGTGPLEPYSGSDFLCVICLWGF